MTPAYTDRCQWVPSGYPLGVTDFCYPLLEPPHGGSCATRGAAFGIRSEVSLTPRSITPLRVSK